MAAARNKASKEDDNKDNNDEFRYTAQFLVSNSKSGDRIRNPGCRMKTSTGRYDKKNPSLTNAAEVLDNKWRRINAERKASTRREGEKRGRLTNRVDTLKKSPRDSSMYQKDQLQFGSRNTNESSWNVPRDMERNMERKIKMTEMLTYHELEDLLQLPPNELLITLKKHKNELSRLLEWDLTSDYIFILSSLFSKVCDTKLTHNKIEILSQLQGSRFFQKACTRLLLIDGEIEIGQQRGGTKILFCQNLTRIFCNAAEMLPSIIWDLPIDQLKTAICQLNFETKENEENLHKDVDFLLNLRKETAEDIQSKHNSKYQTTKHPPNDFRSLSTLPTNDEISNKKVFLRPIKSKGSYPDTQTYLDVQYRLFREDFFGPLRQGIEDLRVGETRKKGSQKIKVYCNVKVLYPCLSNTGIVYKVEFDVSKLQHVCWAHTKRLIFGSLLCLTNDGFQTSFFATVANREEKLLKLGHIYIQFLNKEQEANIYRLRQIEFLMAECPTYFEAYRHVSDTIKAIENDKLPFQEYFVECKINGSLPSYLAQNQGFPYDLRTSIGIKTANKGVFCIVKSHQWPSKEEVDLNMSQLEAFKYALTNKLALIQGPPGTGKTFLGQRIVHALLVNKGITMVGSGTPLLIVCYTNHALDQFLKGLIDLGHTAIIRAGSRCRDETMKEFSLRNTSINLGCTKKARKLNQLIFTEKENRDKMADDMRWVENTYENVHSCHSKGRPLPLHDLLWVIRKEISEHFYSFTGPVEFPVLEIWLHLWPFDETTLIRVREDLKSNENNCDDQNHTACVENDSQIQIEAEGDVLMDRWGHKNESNVLMQNFPKPIRKRTKNIKFISPDGFEYVPFGRNARLAIMTRYMKENQPMSEQEVNEVENPFSLTIVNRWRLYKYWVEKTLDMADGYVEAREKYNECCSRIEELTMERDNLKLQGAQVVGMTTSFAARYRNCLETLKPKIAVVEEAAEVLEAHILACVPSSVEHLILIGDHKQLKPSPAVYNLAKNYNLELSLFERMVNNGVQLATLNVQHRMRPEISDIILPIYPELKNHSSVMNFENIRGVTRNLFFIDHMHPESNDTDLQSKRNFHEARYIKALCWYLIQQGYNRSCITILTMYTGQLLEFKNIMPKAQFEGVRVSSVDNFQGEENDIILLSLVRSNSDLIGFVGIENRICVALSRARKGLFVIGNFTLLKSKSTMWQRICTKLEQKQSIGQYLRLRCWNHPEKEILAEVAEDFKNAPNGGCIDPCGYRLKCGHSCIKACHPVDQEHKKYQCKKPCSLKVCSLQHTCTQTCHYGESCGPCLTIVVKRMPICEHEQYMECSLQPETFSCKAPCERYLECGHKCLSRCGENCNDKLCVVMVDYDLPCGHRVRAECHTRGKVKCFNPCRELLKCSHTCKGTCGTCLQGRMHTKCTYTCQRTLVCSHICMDKCKKACPPCKKQCMLRCFHSNCKNTCGELCTPCREPCLWECQHYRCSKLCSEICDREICNEPCNKLLSCDHPCIGLCGERCPQFCRVCNKEEVEEIFFGTEDDPTALFLQLEDCKHFFEVSALDRWIESGPNTNNSQVGLQIQSCPKCKTPIVRTLRYSNKVKAMISDIEQVKLKMGTMNSFDKERKKQEIKAKVSTEMMKNNTLKIYIIEAQKFFKSKSKCSTLRKKAFKDLTFVQEKKLSKVGKKIYQFLACLGKIESLHDFISFENAWNLTYDLLACYEKIKADGFISTESKKELLGVIDNALEAYDPFLTEHQIEELQLEITRIKAFYHVYVTIDSNVFHEKKMKINFNAESLIQYVEVFKSGRVLTVEELSTIDKLNKNIREKLSLVGISESEKREVIKAIGLKSGHWFKCPNGHVYAIGECGGAVQTGICPECKAKIGGTRHNLLPDNQHAAEFDNSSYPAYSDAANMNNYHFGDAGF